MRLSCNVLVEQVTIHAVSHIVSVIRDITERKQAEEALMESEEKYRSILNASPDDITITDLEGRILMISPAAKKMFGYEPNFDRFIGMRLIDFIVPEDVERAQSNILLMYQGGSCRTAKAHHLRRALYAASCLIQLVREVFHWELNTGIHAS